MMSSNHLSIYSHVRSHKSLLTTNGTINYMEKNCKTWHWNGGSLLVSIASELATATFASIGKNLHLTTPTSTLACVVANSNSPDAVLL